MIINGLIFHSYVKIPEGNHQQPQQPQAGGWSNPLDRDLKDPETSEGASFDELPGFCICFFFNVCPCFLFNLFDGLLLDCCFAHCAVFCMFPRFRVDTPCSGEGFPCEATEVGWRKT